MPSTPRTRSVSPEELEYYRTHFLEAIREEQLSLVIFNGLARRAGLHQKCRPRFAVFDEESAAWIGMIFVDENGLTKLTILPLTPLGLGNPRPPTALELAYTKHAFLGSERD